MEMWILLIFFRGQNHFATVSQEFNSKETCEYAVVEIQKYNSAAWDSGGSWRGHYKAWCFKK